MPAPYRVHLEVTRHVIYEVPDSDAANVQAAVRRASESFWEGSPPDDEEWGPGVEVERIEYDGREVFLLWSSDWKAPADALGIYPQIVTVLDANTAERHEVAQGSWPDVQSALNTHLRHGDRS